MMEIIFYIGLIGLSFYAGWFAREYIASVYVNKMLNTFGEMEKEQIANSIATSVEVKDDMIFIYAQDSGEYLAHGPTMNFVTTMLTTKFPDKKFLISKEDLQKLLK